MLMKQGYLHLGKFCSFFFPFLTEYNSRLFVDFDMWMSVSLGGVDVGTC